MSIEAFLTNIRLSIVGDDEIKQLVIESSNFKEMYKVLDEIINQPVTDHIQLELLDKILIIINSLSYYLPKVLNDNNTANRLVLVAIKFQNDDKILNNTFRCLMNFTSTNISIKGLNLDSDIGHEFTELLGAKLNQFESFPKHNNSLYLQIFKLIPHLNPFDLKILLPSLLNILKSVLQVPQLLLLSKYKNSDIYLNCHENQTIPTMPPLVKYSVLLPPLLYSISHLISHESFTQSVSVFKSQPSGFPLKDELLRVDELIDRDLYFTLSSLLKSNTQDLKLASLTVLVNFSLYSSLSKLNKINNVKKILPVLIQLTDSFDKSEDTLTSFKSEYKHSKNFNPFFILSKLCLEFEFVHDFLINCNIIDKISQFLKHINKNQDIETVSIEKQDNLIDFFLILSSITSENESNRKLIINDDLLQVIDKILKNHYKILNDEIITNRNVEYFERLSVSNHLTLSATYLLRSLSRSVSMLRTSLYEKGLLNSLFQLIKINEIEIETTFKSLVIDPSSSNTFINDEVLLKSVILSILSNFVLDFSPLRTYLLVDCDLINVISVILLNTRHQTLIRNALWCSRHILFNEKPAKKDEYLEKISIEKIFDFILSEESDEVIQKEAFDVIRNLTCDSKKHVFLTLNYKPTPDFDFFQLVNKVLVNSLNQDPVNNSLLETVVFVIVNMAGVYEKTRDLIASRKDILFTLKNILESDRVSSDAKIACVWVLINLTWTKTFPSDIDDEAYDEQINEQLFYEDDEGLVLERRPSNVVMTDAGSTTDSDSREQTTGVETRTKIVQELGFSTVLSELLENTSNYDLKERSKACLNGISHFDNN